MPEIGNTSVFSQTDASNNGGTMPGWNGSASPNTIDDAGRALQGAVTREWNWRGPTVTSGGTADAQTLTYTVAPAALYNGQEYHFIAGFTNTGSATLNINSLGAKTFKKDAAGTWGNLAAGDIVAGSQVRCTYHLSTDTFRIVSISNYGDALTSVNTTITNLRKGWQWISTTTLSANATKEFTSLSSYVALRFDLINIMPATDDVQFLMRLSSDGSTYLTSSYEEYILDHGGSAWNNPDLVGPSAFVIENPAVGAALADIGNAAGDGGLAGFIELHNFGSAQKTMAFGSGVYGNTSGAFVPWSFRGWHTTQSAMQAVRILFSSGNLSSGTVILSGLTG